MLLILHNYRRCPYCIRVRIVLQLLDIEHVIIEEPLRAWTMWMREHIEKPRVPVVHIEEDGKDDLIMPESNDINLYLDKHFGKGQLTPQADSPQYQEMLHWWNWCDTIFKPQIDNFKYGRDGVFDREANVQEMTILREMIAKLEWQLSQQPYLVGEQRTLADIAIIPFIRQIMRTRGGEFDFTGFPRVLQWANHILEEEWFDAIVMKK